jgi:hypothetical protein
MGPCLGPKCQVTLDGLHKIGRQTVGAADQEDQPTYATIPERRDLLGEDAGGPGPAAFIAGDHVSVDQVWTQSLGLGSLAGFAALDLDDLNRTKAQRAPRRRRPVGV